jgi:hypothetical protein
MPEVIAGLAIVGLTIAEFVDFRIVDFWVDGCVSIPQSVI